MYLFSLRKCLFRLSTQFLIKLFLFFFAVELYEFFMYFRLTLYQIESLQIHVDKLFVRASRERSTKLLFKN